MRRDQRKAPTGTSLVPLSASIFRRMLAAYPASFRREYSAEMCRLFRDCAREAVASAGMVGLWRYWLRALGDLSVNAVAERRRQEVHMSRVFWMRVGSLAGVLGGALAFLTAALGIVVGALQLQDSHSSLGLSLFQVQFATERLAPSLALLFVLALIGLQARGAARAGAVGWIGITLAMMGEVIALLGGVPQAILINSQSGHCASPLDCNFYDPSGYFMLSYFAGLVGALLLACGLIAYGIVTLRRSVLARANGLPLALGLLTLVGFAAPIAAMLASSGTDYAGTEKLAILMEVAPFVVGILWMLLGLALWPREREATVTAPQVA